MPTKIILSNLDLDLNQLLKAKLENLATDPANSGLGFITIQLLKSKVL
jgi:hypothetical protein